MRRQLLQYASQMLQRRGLYLTRLSSEDQAWLKSAYAPDTPAPADADAWLRADHTELKALRERYARIQPGLGRGRRWSAATIDQHVNLRQFRGDSPYMWHYRELPQLTRLKYYLWLRYVQEQDTFGLLERLTEDGAFGCWTLQFPDQPPVSRDLLDSVNEIAFLERQLGVLSRPGLRLLDIGAGYGRLAHRTITAQPETADYCCVDAVAESTFLCDYYLRYRKCTPPARIVAYDEIDNQLAPGSFDLALNVHSFSECTVAAVDAWLQRLQALEVPYLFVVPNDGDRLLSMEPDGSRRDFADRIAAAGYHLQVSEPVIAEAAIRELLGIHDHFLLFKRDSQP